MPSADIYPQHRIIPILLMAFLLIFSGQNAFAQDTQSDPATKEIRIPDENRLDQISKNPAYNYNTVAEEPSAWERFKMFIREIFSDLVDTPFISTLIKGISIIAILVIILLFINQIVKGELKNAFMRRNNRNFLGLRFNNSNTENQDFDALINDSIRKNDYTNAVRFLYQKALVHLKSKELITWKQNKTNYEYVTELGSHPAEPAFRRLTYFYEYVDYGDFKINSADFDRIQSIYEQLELKTTGSQ
jgi:hypothetical protein